MADQWRQEVADAIRDLRGQVAALESRLPIIGSARNPRLAITIDDPSTGSYPARSTNPDTYHIVFVDGSYPDAVGQQSETLKERQATTSEFAKAHAIAGGPYIPEGSLIAVFWQNGQWWFQPPLHTAFIIKALVDEAGGVATTDATFNIDTVSVIYPPEATLPTTPTVVNNILGFPAQDNAAVIAFYNQTTGLWEGIPAPWFWTC